MVTAMEDACPNGVREEEEVTPLGQPGMEGPPAARSTQGADTSGAMQQVLTMGELPTHGRPKTSTCSSKAIMESTTPLIRLITNSWRGSWRRVDNNMELVYVRPYFDYNPANDNLIPCREAGMAFKKGDILQIVNREDPNWWQACHVVGGATGLIPSQFLEEKRKAFVPRDFDGSGILCGTIAGKKKKKMMYLTAKNAEFDRHELQIYEEVAKVPPFQRKTLVLIGAQGVGRRSLKNRLMVLQPTRFGTTIPYTSRRARDEELDGNTYHFTSRTEMEVDVKAGRFLEHGEYDGNLYGTKIDSIHEVVATGRTCILDVNPQALKVLKTAEFMPYVVFIAAPDFDTLKAMHKAVVDAGITTKQLTDVDLRKTVDESARIQRAYSHYFDLTIVNDNLDRAFETLQAAVDKLCSEPQWVPVNWVY
ncbi:MAGUK p55 subfamily member 6-like protein [Lates japonicus]|uniref:MAGUK p55 subfamily member 6-like protein n=1 Tax=Lates japonicus TaxID=270547 RepID=A0AAD3R7K3_LATJO|nr:MAGUK p55 subfamily member 6-like protein [Lates japonicus]